MSQSDQVRIDDLRTPHLTEKQRAALEFGSTLEVSFDESTLGDEAMTRTGLSDFGPDDFWPRLRGHLTAIDKDRGLNGLARLTLRRRVVRLLSSRLLLTDLLRRHPEIEHIEIANPMIIVGLPRSGTTHLVNLLAADTRFRSLPFWESQEPFPVRHDGPGPDGVDPRWQRCADEYAAGVETMPLTRAMHDRHPASIEEEVELLDIDFASYALEWHARVPDWRDLYLHLDQRSHYRYLKTVLKALTFLRGPETWVLKSPQHLEQLGPLIDAFPDAMVAFTHRDPVAVIQSAITMLAYADRLRRHEIEPDQLAEYWVDRVERLLRSCVRDRDLIAVDRSVDVVFHELMADDIGIVAEFYERAGREMTPRARGQLDRYTTGHPRGAHGRINYDLTGDFGLDPSAVRARFDFYFERFPVIAEV